jgi:Lsr2
MAQKVVTTITDDLDGTEADETLEFVWEGIEYRIDLCEKNADKFRKVIAPYLTAAQRVGGRAKRRATVISRPASNAADVRAWAIENGYQVPDRGRIPNDVRAAYEEAHA